MYHLTNLLNEVRDKGYGVFKGGLSVLERDIDGSVRVIPNRRTSSPRIERLRPTPADKAQQRSMSRVHGLGEQPLHTDGAHLETPPDVVLLSCPTRSEIPTRFARFVPPTLGSQPMGDLVHGLFIVDSGSDSFLAPILDFNREGHAVRYDPVCMTPGDPRACRAMAAVKECLPEVHEFEWNEPGLVLALDNRRYLHARADASNEPERTLERLALRVERAPS
ncbi:hypothetical protein [Nocardioides yefusunii]|uniref:TauD/TfdA-like domain-containing protein n=1 Tax=Nocardioides yefusunii TaxID=2500546 RepID=A0ABW1QU26_9ACTN|nr:hypothetical protein [Nocardioides yefusunii]